MLSHHHSGINVSPGRSSSPLRCETPSKASQDQLSRDGRQALRSLLSGRELRILLKQYPSLGRSSSSMRPKLIHTVMWRSSRVHQASSWSSSSRTLAMGMGTDLAWMLSLGIRSDTLHREVVGNVLGGMSMWGSLHQLLLLHQHPRSPSHSRRSTTERNLNDMCHSSPITMIQLLWPVERSLSMASLRGYASKKWNKRKIGKTPLYFLLFSPFFRYNIRYT